MKVREKLILYTHPNCDYSPMKKDELNDDGRVFFLSWKFFLLK